MTIRLLELEDLPKVYSLGEDLFSADKYTNLYRFWNRYELAELYVSDGDFCLVAESDEGELQGFVLGTILDRRRSSWRYGAVLWLGVSPDFKRQGIGMKLLEKLQEVFIKNGVRMMLIDTQMDNEGAIAMFEKFGFNNPVEQVYLSKNLTTLPEYVEWHEKNGE